MKARWSYLRLCIFVPLNSNHFMADHHGPGARLLSRCSINGVKSWLSW